MLKTRTGKKLLSLLLSLTMVLGLLPAMSITAAAAAVAAPGGMLTALTADNLDAVFGSGNYTYTQSTTTVQLKNDLTTADSITIAVSCTLDTNNKSINRGLTAAPTNGKGGSVLVIGNGTDAVTVTMLYKYSTYIKGGYAENGGGTYVKNQARLIAPGIQIQNSTASGNGGGVYAGGTFSARGSTHVYQNKKGTANNNVYLPDGKTISILGTVSQEIYVTTAVTPTDSAPVAVTNEYTADYSEKIKSDNSAYHVYSAAENGKWVLKLTSASAEPAFNVTLKPQSTNMIDSNHNSIYAGRNITYDLMLTQTNPYAPSTLGYNDSTAIFGLVYDGNLTYQSTSLQSYELSNNTDAHRLNIYKSSIAITRTLDGTASKLGDVTFTVPSADTVTASGTDNVYRIQDISLTGNTSQLNQCGVNVSGYQSALIPTAAQYAVDVLLPPPSVTLGGQSAALTAGTGGSATYSVSVEDFTNTLADGNFALTWYTDDTYGTAGSAPGEVTSTLTASLLTLTTASNTPIGTYYFKVTATDATVEPDETAFAAGTLVVSPTRSTALNFDLPTISYKDVDGNDKDSISTAANIIDSGEGWAWYHDGTTVDGTVYAGKVLVLSGLRPETTAPVAVTLPANTTVVLKSGTVNTVKSGAGSSAHAYGIQADNGLAFTGTGTLNVTGGAASGSNRSCGILLASGDMTVNGPTITSNGGTAAEDDSTGISVFNGKLIVSSGTVTGIGSASSTGNSYGVNARLGVQANGGSVTATAGAAGTGGISVGAYSGGIIDVTAGTLTASGATAAIISESNITFASAMAVNTPSSAAVGDGESVFGYPCKTILSGTTPAASVTIGIAPLPPAPSGGGSTSSVTVPASSEQGSVKVSAAVSGGKATISVTDAQIKEIASDTKDTGTVKVDASTLKVDEAVIPAKLVNAAATASGSEGLEVVLPAGSVTLDNTALQSVGNNTIVVSVEDVKPAALNDIQKETVGEKLDTAIVVDINVLVNGVKTSNFNGGVISVSVPYAPKANEDTSKLMVWYLADDGSIEPMNGKYNTKTGCFEFTTTHLSVYVMGSFPFTDVKADSYYYNAVVWALASGVTDGKTASTFAPSATCTRAQTVTFLWRAMGSPEPTTKTCAFTDVKADAYYYQAVLWAAEKKITKGTTDTTFSPDATVTRGQVVTFQWRVAGAKAVTAANPFTDVAAGTYCTDAVLWAVSEKITEGITATTFAPAKPCTRAQIVTFLYRQLGK